jgi:hypothetical protein
MKNDKAKLKTVRTWFKELILPNMKMKPGASKVSMTETINKLDNVKKISEQDFRTIFIPKKVEKPAIILADVEKKEVRIFDPYGNYVKK